jgi:hypothetical protein
MIPGLLPDGIGVRELDDKLKTQIPSQVLKAVSKAVHVIYPTGDA